MKHASKWLLLTVLALAQFMVVLDVSVVNVGLPAIKQALHFSTTNLQWVITAYALTFGGFLLLGGRAADLFGRRRVLMAGMAAFTLFSFLIGISQSASELIILRTLQGLSAALMSPSALSIVLATFRDGKDRNTALGIWATVAAGGAAVGLLLGGIIVQYFGWRWNFFINVPVGIIELLAIMRIVPRHDSEATHRDLDLPGAVLVTGGLMLSVYTITQAPTNGWLSITTLATATAAILALFGFIANEKRSRHPLVPLSIFRSRTLVGANLMMAPTYAGMLGMFFLSSIYLQTIRHYSPVETGLSFLIFPIIFGTVTRRVSRLVGKLGYRPFLIVGPLLTALGMTLLSHLSVQSAYLTGILPAFAIIPIGVGMTMVSLTIAATSGVPAQQSGLASGLISTSQQMGGALGLTILSGIAAAVTRASHSSSAYALVKGYDRAFMFGAALMLLVVVLALTVIGRKKEKHTQVAAHVAIDAA